MRARVYIDGFNLYYRALKRTPYRWLDLAAFSQAIAPSFQIDRIRYFTANALPKPGQQVSLDQQAYLRALRTIPNLDILPIYVVNPQAHRRSFELANVSTKYYEVFKRTLKDSQFPPTLVGPQGVISKPHTW